jgi:hypothetical protein
MKLEVGEWIEHESREYGNQTSGSVIRRGFLDFLDDWQLVEENFAL